MATTKQKGKSGAFQATPEQLKAWEKKYGKDKVFHFTVKPDLDKPELDKACYLMKPSRHHFSMLNDTVGTEHLKRQEELLYAIWIDGDEEIKTDDDYFLNVITRFNELIPTFAVELEKK